MNPDPCPFREIHEAWKSGRPIVPLFGAGISVESGIPLTRAMVAYLTQLKWYVDEYEAKKVEQYKKKVEVSEYLLTHGWPEPHDLTSKLIPRLQRDFRPELQGQEKPNLLWEIEKEVLERENLADQPDVWLQLLSRITDGRQDLKDLFFDRLEEGRGPSTCHHFIAFLAVLMNWRLILTTNFDPFIEQALRNISIEPRIYELADRGPIPDPDLVRAHLSLLKMHGGSFARLMGETLSHSLLVRERQQLLKYLPSVKNCLMLIVGYGGNDRRVMSVIREFLNSPREKNGKSKSPPPRLIWIDRADKATFEAGICQRLQIEPRDCESLGLRIVGRKDGARFLQELHSRLSTTHRATPTSYAVFPHLPKATAEAPPPSEPPAHSDRIVVFYSDVEKTGTSTALSRYAQSASNHTVIWCDMGLGLLSSVEGLLSFLEREFRKHDSALPPFSIFPPQKNGSDVDSRVSYVVEALERGRYLIALDSLGEFRTSHVADDADWRDYLDNELKIVESKLKDLHKFLEELARQIAASQYCESILCLALSPFSFGKAESGSDSETVARDFRWHLQENCGARVEEQRPKDKPEKYDPKEKLLPVWKDSESDLKKRLELCVCAVFRRPRSIVVLRRIFAVLHSRWPQKSIAGFLDALQAFDIREIDEDKRNDIDDKLAKIADKGLLFRDQGGFFWMHRAVRDFFYRKLRATYPQIVTELHNAIATYYYHQVYLPSKDTEALFEYIFHRLASVRFKTNSPGNLAKRDARVRELIVVLQRERDQLLTHRNPGLLVPWINYLRDTELAALADKSASNAKKSTKKSDRVADEQFQVIYRESRLVLCEMEAECLRQSGAYEECIVLRSKQIGDRLIELKCRSGAKTRHALIAAAEALKWNSEAAVANLRRAIARAVADARDKLGGKADNHVFLRLLSHVVEIAACVNGLRAGDSEVKAILRHVADVIGKESNFSGTSQKIREQLKDLKIRHAHRQMEAELAPLSIWSEQKSDQRRLQNAIDAFRDGDRELRDYVEHQDRNFFRYTCVLNTLRARSAYLSPQFEEAYRWLEAASAAIRRPVRGSEYSTSAISLMHHAECLIKHAEYRLDSKKKDPPGETAWNRAHAKLDRARIDLERAHDLLLQGRPQLWAWTRLFILAGQLNHDLLLLSLDKDAGRSKREEEFLHMTRSRYILNSLRSIRAALDSGIRDEKAKREAVILWHQLYVCQAFRELHGRSIPPKPSELAAALVKFFSKDRCKPKLAAKDAWVGFNELARLDRRWTTWLDKYSTSLRGVIKAWRGEAPFVTVRQAVLSFQEHLLREIGVFDNSDNA